MSKPKIDVIQTEQFHDNYSKQCPDCKAADIWDYMGDKWNNYVNPDGNYPANFDYVDDSDLEIPRSVFNNTDSLYERRQEAHKWLYDNYYTNNGTDAAVVLDHWGGGGDCNTDTVDRYGSAKRGTAGEDDIPEKTAIVDCFYEDDDTCENLAPEYDAVLTEGICYHELLHLFNAQHEDDVSSYDKTDSASFMWNPGDDVLCYDRANPTYIEGKQSDCCVYTVQDYYDNTTF